MKLRRSWPAVCIWSLFIIFNIVMVGSSSYFAGFLPTNNRLAYTAIFTIIAVEIMLLIVRLLSVLRQKTALKDLADKPALGAVYLGLCVVIFAAGIWLRIEELSSLSGSTITGKLSLYENAMVGATPGYEYDLLSIVYSSVLRVILFFTGNFNFVPFYFQMGCFIVFMICSLITVRLLLGRLASVIYLAYVAFMPVFTPIFTGLELSTDYMFMALFGAELLIVAIFLKGADSGKYVSKLWVIWYFVVGFTIGFMAYVDAGTAIMILPFVIAPLFLYQKKPLSEAWRILFVLIGAALCFFGMIAQEQGFALFTERLSKWGSFYFHNLNTFSMFWTYTDYKITYLVTVIAMSGVTALFWKNRRYEQITPWLLSMILIFATVPFMGATRMNTQIFVTVYYAFILGCVGSLIAMPGAKDPEDAESEIPVSGTDGKNAESETYAEENSEGVGTIDAAAKENADAEEDAYATDSDAGSFDAKETDYKDTYSEYEADSYTDANVDTETEGEVADSEAYVKPVEDVNTVAAAEINKEANTDAEAEDSSKAAKDAYAETDTESVLETETDTHTATDTDSDTDSETDTATATDTAIHTATHTAIATVTFKSSKDANNAKVDDDAYGDDDDNEADADETTDRKETTISMSVADITNYVNTELDKKEQEAQRRYVPEGMVLPEDPEDADQTPRMKMPKFEEIRGEDGKLEKLKIYGVKKKEYEDWQPAKKKPAIGSKYSKEFDLEFKPGDDFDI